MMHDASHKGTIYSLFISLMHLEDYKLSRGLGGAFVCIMSDDLNEDTIYTQQSNTLQHLMRHISKFGPPVNYAQFCQLILKLHMHTCMSSSTTGSHFVQIQMYTASSKSKIPLASITTWNHTR